VKDPGLEAQEKQARLQAEAYKKAAGRSAEASATQIAGFTEQAGQAIGQTMTVLGKTGQLGLTSRESAIESGVDIGEVKTEELIGLEESVASKREQLERLTGTVAERGRTGSRLSNQDGEDRAAAARARKIKDLEKEIAAGERKISTISEPFSELEEVRDVDDEQALLSGSSGLNTVQLRDMLERDRRQAVRAGMTDAWTQYETGEMQSKTAEILSDAQGMAMLQNTISLAGRIGLGFAGAAAGGLPYGLLSFATGSLYRPG